jgi:hypothetical protein
MQLKKNSSVRLGLMTASCALLGAQAPAVNAAGGESPLQIDTALLYYKENAGRVQTIEPVVELKKDFGDERILTGTLTFDSLTGGSPNGALPSRLVQTFTSASRGTTRTVVTGDLPLDKTFKDTRVAGDIGWSQPMGELSHVSFGGHLSKEYDFTSAGVNAGVSRDFNQKNTTLSFGVNAEFDSINPVGGAPVPLSNYALATKKGTDSRNVHGALLGVTQVMSRYWLMSLNYSYDKSSGYMTDPYKIVTRVDATGATLGYLYESRPRDRARKSLYIGNKIALGSNVLDLSLRHGSDDWGVKSNMVDGRLHVRLDGDLFVEPHARWYHQNAADFYNLYITPSDTPKYTSSDQRLAEFDGTTFGVKVGEKLYGIGEVSVSLETYNQTPKTHTSALTQLRGLDLNPGLRAVMFQVGWRTEF